MPSLEARIEKLEQGGTAGACQCQPRRLHVIWPDGAETGAAICPSCGKPTVRLVVKYENPIEGARNG